MLRLICKSLRYEGDAVSRESTKGGNDSATCSWRRWSLMLAPTTWRGGGWHLPKVAVSMAVFFFLFLIYQSSLSQETSRPVWLSLSFVPSPSFLKDTQQLPLSDDRTSPFFLPSRVPSPIFKIGKRFSNDSDSVHEKGGNFGSEQSQSDSRASGYSAHEMQDSVAVITRNLTNGAVGTVEEVETRNGEKLREDLPPEVILLRNWTKNKERGVSSRDIDGLSREELKVPLAPISLGMEGLIPLHLEKPSDARLKIEHELLAAKQAIAAATPFDDDQSLYPVIFHNVSSFSKSYKLMEEIFRVYVYEEGDERVVHTGPLLGIYASEGKFIKQIEQGSLFNVQDPEKAHMFFMPYSVTQMTLTIYVEGSHSMLPLNTYIKDYVNALATKYPFWNRTRGADHFFVSCHDWGPATARDHDELRTNAVKVVCNADLTEEYVPGKDASLPEIYLHSHKRSKIGGPGPSKRPYLAFFAGQMHGRVRPALIEHWKDKDPDMKIYEVLPKKIARKMNYIQHLKKSKFCVCAAGFEVNSPRIVESIYYDCVPVIIADNFVLPFSDVLNWSTFSVTILERDIPNLKSILLNISPRQYESMQKRLSKVRQHFLWNDKPVKYDVFHMILHSVWKSRLNHLNHY